MSITTEQLEKMVRTLVWEDADEGMCTKWRAAALGGRYELVDLDKDGRLAVNFCWGRPLSFWFIQGEHDQFGPTGPKQFPTLEVAMAAAHADYAARVLAALDMDILAETFRPPPAELAAANARADQARDDALVEACGERYNEMMSRVAYDLVSVGNRHQRRAHEAKFRKANK